MHYRDGTEAREGDIVRGRGYNLPYEIVGPVTKLVPSNGDTCNLRVTVMVAKYHPFHHDDGSPDTPAHFTYEPYEESGEARAFELVHREGWQVALASRFMWAPDDASSVRDRHGESYTIVARK